ncbi:hypothetical protein Hanom_Chr02g00169641 [Helianthus anomalus]
MKRKAREIPVKLSRLILERVSKLLRLLYSRHQSPLLLFHLSLSYFPKSYDQLQQEHLCYLPKLQHQLQPKQLRYYPKYCYQPQEL